MQYVSTQKSHFLAFKWATKDLMEGVTVTLFTFSCSRCNLVQWNLPVHRVWCYCLHWYLGVNLEWVGWQERCTFEVTRLAASIIDNLLSLDEVNWKTRWNHNDLQGSWAQQQKINRYETEENMGEKPGSRHTQTKYDLHSARRCRDHPNVTLRRLSQSQINATEASVEALMWRHAYQTWSS